MKTIPLKIILTSLMVLALSSTHARAGRILIHDNNQTVTLNQSLDCYKAAQITIDTRNPEIYQQGTRQLQAIGDAVRAMLSYECPGLDEIELNGLIRGLGETVYRGRLSARDGWLVRPVALELDRLAARPKSRNVTPHTATSNNGGVAINSETLSLTGLELGMSIAAAIEAVETAFEISPHYDPENGMMTLQTGGCPADFDTNAVAYQAQSEWKCLKAWFSDKRIPALERVELIQVVHSDTGSIKQRLTEKYGAPGQNDITATNAKSHMQWQTTVDARGRTPSLDASLSTLEPMLVLTRLTLSDQLTQVQRGTAYTDIGLQL